MDFKIIKPKANGKIDFINDNEIVRCNNKYYLLSYQLKNIETLYSLPNNDKHIPYTKRENITITDKMKPVIKKYWSPYKVGDIVEGDIIDNIFNVIR